MVLSYQTKDWRFFMPFGLVVSVIYVLIVKRYIFNRIDKISRKIFIGDENKEIFGKQEIEIQEDGIYEQELHCARNKRKRNIKIISKERKIFETKKGKKYEK